MSFSFTNASTKSLTSFPSEGRENLTTAKFYQSKFFVEKRFREKPSWGTSRRTRNILKFSEIQAQCMNIQAVWLHTRTRRSGCWRSWLRHCLAHRVLQKAGLLHLPWPAQYGMLWAEEQFRCKN